MMMRDNLRLVPNFLTRDRVRLAHFEAGPSAPQSPPLVLVQGWTGDHRIFAPQIAHFSRNRRVVAVNLRGHGASDAPKQEYTLPSFADDVAWQCGQLGLEKPMIIGHSLGGVVALELCGCHPDLAAGVIMIDSPVLPPLAVRESPDMHRLIEAIGGPDYQTLARANAWESGCDYDDPARRKAIFDEYILPPCEKTPQHVAYSSLKNAILNYDPEPAARACKIPMAYISADTPQVDVARDLDRLKELCPQLMIAKTLLSGHFNTLEVADQVNAMIERFLSVGLNRARSDA
jgi:pimeloyl-ACP methyl ester carboxylesterase